MPVALDDYARLSLAEIVVSEDRQRADLDLDESFLHSIRSRGILTPLFVRKGDNLLLAGGRRLSAACALGLSDVPVRFFDSELDVATVALIELEENIRRTALPWQDEARAIALLHSIYSQREGWTLKKTSEELAIGPIHLWLRVAHALEDEEESKKISNAPGMRAAYNICERIDTRANDAVMEHIATFSAAQYGSLDTASGWNEQLDASSESLAPVDGPTSEGGELASGTLSTGASTSLMKPVGRSSPPLALCVTRGDDVLCLDFIEWARTYSGPRFNFIHCDFPYGKRVNSGEWGGKNSESEFKYDDSPEVYWQLCTALCENVNRLCADSCHLMFWLSSEIENMYKTVEFFREHAPSFIFQKRALTWHKSDNVGIVPDPLRGPRWIVETCLMASRGDRPLVRPLASSYSAPTVRSLHPSTKPEPVLRHFFGMFVDGTTRLLDPTCGSGSALRAAESLGACAVMGIEQSHEFAESAQKALKEFRNLRELTR